MTTDNSKVKIKNDDRVVNFIITLFTLMIVAAPIVSIFQGFSKNTESSRQQCFSSARDKLTTQMQESGNTTIDSMSEVNAITQNFESCN